MVWVETDGTVYWAVAEHLVPTHGDGANRNDNKYIDNGPTWRQVIGNNSVGVEFAGNFPDVTRGPTEAQIAAWKILVKVLRARYGIPLDRVYAHNWIDYKDARYCEGCALAKMAREWGTRGGRLPRQRASGNRRPKPPVPDRNQGWPQSAFLSPSGTPPFRERLGKVGRGLRDDLVRIAPDHFTLVGGCDGAHRQATLLKQPGAIARAADRLTGLGIEPANAPDRIAPLEVPRDAPRNRQML
jgi:hypothetical protein